MLLLSRKARSPQPSRPCSARTIPPPSRRPPCRSRTCCTRGFPMASGRRRLAGARCQIYAATLGLLVEGHRGLRAVPWILVDAGDRLAVGRHGPHDDVEYLALALVALFE